MGLPWETRTRATPLGPLGGRDAGDVDTVLAEGGKGIGFKAVGAVAAEHEDVWVEEARGDRLVCALAAGVAAEVGAGNSFGRMRVMVDGGNEVEVETAEDNDLLRHVAFLSLRDDFILAGLKRCSPVRKPGEICG